MANSRKRRDYAESLTDDVDMQRTLRGEGDHEAGATPMDKLERDYFNSPNVGRSSTALEAIRRARKANKKPPLKYGS